MLKGIDAATWQGYPTWPKVKSAGIDFAMIKATQGRAESSDSYLFEDSKFRYNITNAPAAGILCGVYDYLTAQNVEEARTEANYFIKAITPYKDKIALYAAVDVESKYLKSLSKEQLSAILEAFCATVAAAGFTPIAYTNPDWLNNRLDGIGDCKLWLACWPDTVDADNPPAGYGDLSIWQWGTSAVRGIYGNVDSNFGYFDVDNIGGSDAAETVPSGRDKISIGDTVRVENPINYDTGRKFTLYYAEYDVIQISGDRVVVGIGKRITAPVHINYIEKI